MNWSDAPLTGSPFSPLCPCDESEKGSESVLNQRDLVETHSNSLWQTHLLSSSPRRSGGSVRSRCGGRAWGAGWPSGSRISTLSFQTVLCVALRDETKRLCCLWDMRDDNGRTWWCRITERTPLDRSPGSSVRCGRVDRD